VAAVLLGLPAGLEAQDMVRFVGSVQWISGASVAVGVPSADRRRILARELWRDGGRGYWTQSP
jgi:hypothetical protein